jgi:hypothetical protein
MKRSKCVYTTILIATLAAPGSAQTTTSTPADAAAPSKSVFTQGGVNISGLVDFYGSLNFNHPATRANNLRNFDTRADSFALNMGKLEFAHAAEPVGFRLDLGFGRAFTIFHATDPIDSEFMNYVPQAYVSFAPKSFKGVQVDFGKFYTSAGAELTETHLGWNYSRSLLYANGPYYHFGGRVNIPITGNFSTGFQLVNGWNNVKDNNSGKTMGFTTALTGSKVSWFNNYYVGPEKTDTNEGFRHFYDTVVSITPNNKFNMYVNMDYGVDRNIGGGSNKFFGIGTSIKYQLAEKFYLSPRIEYYNDIDGFITGVDQTLKEFTLTGDYKFHPNLVTRLEYRHDWSNQPFFDRGNEPGSFKRQDTVLVGLVFFFGPKQ